MNNAAVSSDIGVEGGEQRGDSAGGGEQWRVRAGGLAELLDMPQCSQQETQRRM
jgi:hypothetical protein